MPTGTQYIMGSTEINNLIFAKSIVHINIVIRNVVLRFDAMENLRVYSLPVWYGLTER